MSPGPPTLGLASFTQGSPLTGCKYQYSLSQSKPLDSGKGGLGTRKVPALPLLSWECLWAQLCGGPGLRPCQHSAPALAPSGAARQMAACGVEPQPDEQHGEDPQHRRDVARAAALWRSFLSLTTRLGFQAASRATLCPHNLGSPHPSAPVSTGPLSSPPPTDSLNVPPDSPGVSPPPQYCAALDSLISISNCSVIHRTKRMLSALCPHKPSAMWHPLSFDLALTSASPGLTPSPRGTWLSIWRYVSTKGWAHCGSRDMALGISKTYLRAPNS